ncbi:hypothetical protein HDU77_009065 [Chytriomyces hyalinus]|nr:hypothetical protein HDU77_009065 [Chytriomyces hyalinus]
MFRIFGGRKDKDKDKDKEREKERDRERDRSPPLSPSFSSSASPLARSNSVSAQGQPHSPTQAHLHSRSASSASFSSHQAGQASQLNQTSQAGSQMSQFSQPNLSQTSQSSNQPNPIDTQIQLNAMMQNSLRAAAMSQTVPMPRPPSAPQHQQQQQPQFNPNYRPPINTIKYLTSIQMPPRDISISRVQPPQPSFSPSGSGTQPQSSGYIVRVSFRGIKMLEAGVERRRAENAVRLLQRVWRGVLARKLVKGLRKAKEIEARTAAELAVSHQNSSLSSTDAKRASIDKAERRKSKVTAFKSHLFKVSKAYEDIINNTDSPKEGDAPSSAEVDFMRIMNSDETFRLSLNLRAMHKLEKPVSLEEAQRNYELQGGLPGRSPAQMYNDYSPRVVEWVNMVLSFPKSNAASSGASPTWNSTTTDLVTLLRPADPLCHLACQMFPHVQCKLLNKGPEFTIHKAVFFLELCKTVGVKPGMLFSLSDLFLGGSEDDPTRKCGLTVLRTVCALERQARRRGWEGPVMVLKVERTSFIQANAGLLTASSAEQDQNQAQEMSAVSNQQPQHRQIQAPSQFSGQMPNGSTMEAANSSNIPNSNNVLTIGSLTKRSSKMHKSSSSGLNGYNSERGRPQSGSFDQNGLESLGPSGSAGSASKRRSHRASSIASRASEDSMSAAARRNTFQHYVTLLPQNFKSLPRDDKISHLVKLPIAEARESLHVLYITHGNVSERAEYEDLMAFLWANDREESLRKEEYERRVRVALQIREAFSRRNEHVRGMLKQEEAQLANLSSLAEYLENTVNYRLRLYKRKDRGLPTLVQVSPTRKVDIFSPSNPDESPLSTLMRVEAENEELILLDRVVKELVNVHAALVEELKYVLEMEASDAGDEDADAKRDDIGVLAIGDCLMRFATEAATPYMTYATVALGVTSSSSNADGESNDVASLPAVLDIARQEEREPFTDEQGENSLTFQSRVVDCFVGEPYQSLANGESPPAAAPVARGADAQVQEIVWYLAQPLKRVLAYSEVLQAALDAGAVRGEETSVKGLSQLLSGDEEIGAEWRRLVMEDRKFQVSSVKLGCVARSIQSKLSICV